MKKGKIKYVVIIVLTLIVMDRCTLANISLVSIFAEKKFESYSLLKNGVTSDNYEIEYMKDGVYSYITYDTLNNYFLVDGDRTIEKINAKGIIEKTIDMNRGGDLYFPIQSNYILGTVEDRIVYDLSKNNIEEELTNIITITPQNPLENWEFLYNKADVVLYRNEFKDKRYILPIYLRIDGKWTLIMYSDDDYHSIKKTFPKKHKRLIFLKDYKNKLYSISGRESYKGLTSWDVIVDKTFNSSDEGLKNVFFKKKHVYERFNPFGFFELMPTMFVGTGYFQLEKEEDVLKFKNTMLQHALSQKKYSTLYHFSIPEQYRKKSKVSFILFTPYSNYADANAEGVYIVKRKTIETKIK